MTNSANTSVPFAGGDMHEGKTILLHWALHSPPPDTQPLDPPSAISVSPYLSLTSPLSDVLKRHVEHHPQNFSSSRTPVACESCHERKLKCDGSIPCQSCIRSSIQCDRLGLSREDKTSVGSSTDPQVSTGNDFMNENDQLLMDGTNTVLPSSESQQPWFQSVQDPWSPPFSVTGLNVSYPTVLDTSSLSQWNHGRSTPASAPGDTPFISPISREDNSRNERLPRAQAPHNVCNIDTTASSQAPASPSTASQKDYTPDLYSYLHKESPETERLLQLYFSEVHPYWPILHAPTFNTCGASASYVLLGSMLLLASWLEGGHDHAKLAALVFDAVTATILVCPYASL